MKKLVLLRHGESAWNKENRFTGWTDVDLSEKGIQEAHEEALVEPWTWIVVYGSVFDNNGETWPVVLGHNAIIVRRSQKSLSADCPTDQLRLVSCRHELRHTQGQRHVSDSAKLMHDPAPCWPLD